MADRQIMLYIHETENGVHITYAEIDHPAVHHFEVTYEDDKWNTLDYIEKGGLIVGAAITYAFVCIEDVDRYTRAWAEQMAGWPVTEILTKIHVLKQATTQT